ncbi:MAG TPA: folylpolyglutamate synthase/dihydrofolate synthase family protein [Chthoniobacterales bacterium]|nr:folylpolyglutamate synthase/dihydrofolate synthase family protein [Chthoniobacterales bacterium]
MNARQPPAPTYKEALAWLFDTQLFGIKLGLESIQRLLATLELPGEEQRIIHVAGTNGKGSVCAMVDAICRAQGYRTGLFTSPHLITYRERIRADGAMIGADEVAEGVELIRRLVHEWDPHPTFFEITTALALWHFKRTACDIIVLETGMGGRLDATNAVDPVVSVITPIGYDHQKWLGETLSEIAAEKAGIIKPDVPVVAATQLAEAESIILKRAAESAAPLEFVAERYDASRVALAGEHQQQNAALAIAALRVGRIRVDDDAIRYGLATVSWPARFQRCSDQVVIDGAHNAAGARALADTWRSVFGDERATIILAVLQDKDAAAFVAALAPIARRFILPKIRAERALAPAELASVVRDIAPAMPVSIATSCSTAMNETAPTEQILITGSLHFAGEALATIQGVPAAYEECFQ